MRHLIHTARCSNEMDLVIHEPGFGKLTMGTLPVTAALNVNSTIRTHKISAHMPSANWYYKPFLMLLDRVSFVKYEYSNGVRGTENVGINLTTVITYCVL
jgi:hypothetical protein